MTAPQERLPNTTYGITAVCDRRELRLLPTPETSAAFAVAMVEAAERHGVKLVAVGTTSNHYHAVVHDERGRVSEFLRDAHGLMARFGNARDGVKGIGFWDRQQTDTLVLADADAIVGFTAYCIANPVTSFLVKRPEDWLGVATRVNELGTWRGPIYRRPERFFQRDGVVSEWVQLAWELPPLVEAAYGLKGFQREVKARVAALVEGAHREVRQQGIRFLGMDKVLSQSVWDRPKTLSPREAGLRAKARRRVAASDAGLMRALLERLQAFREQHRAAWERYRDGLAAMFPPGTWLAWRYYGARRAEAPAGCGSPSTA